LEVHRDIEMSKSIKTLKIFLCATALASLGACGGGGGSPGTPLLGANAPLGWSMSMTGTPVAGTAAGTPCAANGKDITCTVAGSNSEVNPVDGSLSGYYSVALAVKVVDNSGNAIPNSTVTFSLSASSTGGNVNYCSTASQTTTGTNTCTVTVGGTTYTGTRASVTVPAGFSDPNGKRVQTVTATTNANGVTFATYYPGAYAGTDQVIATVANSTSATVTQAVASATMNVQ
jgi:hypothetical protein